MRHLQQVLGQGNLKHIRHSVVKVHRKKHIIKGNGTPAHKKNYYAESQGNSGEGLKVHKHLKPLKFKF